MLPKPMPLEHEAPADWASRGRFCAGPRQVGNQPRELNEQGSAMKEIMTKLGGLECVVVDTVPEGGRPDLLVVLCHGYGASGRDLVPMASELLRMRPSLKGRTRFVFPAAPLTLAGAFYDARAWWHLDVERLARSHALGEVREVLNEVPEGLPKSRRMLAGMLDELTRLTGVPMSRVVLGGFSQGSMLATDLTLRLEEAPAALCILSGTLIMEDEWRRRAPIRRDLKVLQSHGRSDELLPFALAEALRDMLEQAGLSVEFVPFSDGHTIPGEAMVRLGALLEERLEERLDHVCNLSMRAREWNGELVFLHEAVPGAADRSYGVQVAKLAGVPPAVVARARAVLDRLETESAAHARLDDLPLFAVMEPPAPALKSAVDAAVAALDPDALSPREALEALYRLKGLTK